MKKQQDTKPAILGQITILGTEYEIIEIDFDGEDDEGYHDALLRHPDTGTKEWWTLDASELP